MLPQVPAHPRATVGGCAPACVLAGCGEAPRIRDDVGHPAVGVVVGFRGFASGLAQGIDQVKQGQMALGQVGGLRVPVVHLHVNVEVVIAIPRGLQALGPHALQVRGQVSGPRTADQQVPPELEVEGLQGRVQAALAHGLQALVRRQISSGRRAQVQRDAVEEALVVGNMIAAQVVVGLACGCLQLIGGQALVRASPVAGRSRQQPRVVRRGGHQQHGSVGALHAQRVAVGAH